MPAASADLYKLAERLSFASHEGINQAASEVVRTYAERIKTTAQSLAPIKTGALQHSIAIGYEGELKATIGPHVTYGVYQEFGTGTRGEFPTGPYQIKPKKGKYLTFKINGQWVRVKMVNHPGIPAHPYMRPAVQQVLSDFADELAQAGALQITKGPNA
jgi:HK97 gp10 family phage protein